MIGRMVLMDTDISSVVQFVLEIDKLKRVLRKVRPTGVDRYENSAEHSWQIALFALTLARTLKLSVDINRVVAMLLVHDVGEIDTGDTFFFVEGGWKERKDAELEAVKRIFAFAPPETSGFLLSLWEEFEAGSTPDSRFARAMDRGMPVLLNMANGGGSWIENRVAYEQILARVGPQVEQGCPELWEYLQERLELAERDGWFAHQSS
jgi:putative hydrolase of HD superfamily